MLRLCPVFVLAFMVVAPRAEAQFFPRQVMPGEDFHVEVGTTLWKPTPDVVIASEGLGIIGSTVDFVGDLGIEKTRFREFRLVLKAARKHKFRLSYLPIKYQKEDNLLQRQINFSGQTFNVGLPTNTDVKWDLWRFGYEWDFIAAERALLGFVAELKHNKVTADLASPAGSAAASVTAPIPALGGIVRAYLVESLSVTAEITGMKAPKSFEDTFVGKFVEMDFYASLSLGRNIGVQGGYRSLDVDYVIDEDSGTLKMKGPYFGGVLRF